MPVHPVSSSTSLRTGEPVVPEARAGGDVGATGDDTLRLASILVSGLPAMLGTDDEPTTYTVPVVFTRQVTHPEKTAIEGRDSTQRLAERGYPRVTLKVSDRRLLIGNTTLGQLRDGLAHELVALLTDIDGDLSEQRGREDAEAVARESAAADRAASVQHLVEEIRFV
ncbi:hypothetical protein [Cellulomonas endometrii]|uniref:hypothetical protein n=1 Tax=Cellulomonas endometrii TaxID=3036301 RepID=UPI0024AE5934|nr:hypothetical protein [Cellulomonas endometrii]